MGDAGVGAEPQRAVEHLMQAARRHLGMEAAFISEITDDAQLYRATDGDGASFGIVAGGSTPRWESYCQHVFERGETWVVRDAVTDPVTSVLKVTATSRIGSYIGAPVREPDGRPFGTLCGISHHARPDLGERDVAILETLAEVLGFHVAQLREDARQASALAASGEDLAARLRQQELRGGLLAQMVDASRTPIAVLDPATLRVDFANAAAATRLGAEREAIIGAPLWTYTSWTEASLRARLDGLIAGDVDVVEFEEPDASDPHRSEEIVVQRIVTSAGPPVLLLLLHDVTERRAAAEQLTRSLELERAVGDELRTLDAMRNAFLSAVSHELRTPLTSIRLAAETLQSGRGGPELAPELLGRLTTNAHRLDRLLADLLDLNQFSHGQLHLVRERVRLDELVISAVSQVDPGEHEIRLDLHAVTGEVAPTKFERIVVNLVLNATVHTPPGPITVRLRRTPEGALLVVEDRGPGIDVDERAVLFEPFRQGEGVTAHRPGTGIGLSLVATFTELHGGRVWIEEIPGGGAAFHVVLPMGDGPDEPRVTTS